MTDDEPQKCIQGLAQEIRNLDIIIETELGASRSKKKQNGRGHTREAKARNCSPRLKRLQKDRQNKIEKLHRLMVLAANQ